MGLVTPRALRRMTSSRRSAAAASAASAAVGSSCFSASSLACAAARAAALESSVTERRGVRPETSPACMTTQPQSLSTATRTMSGFVKPVTSFTIDAPSFTARRATSGWRVSTETTAPASASARMTGMTRLASSSGETGRKPGRVDSPPTSMMSAPSSRSFKPHSIAASGLAWVPPSEKESGVTLSTPMMRGRASEISCFPQRQVIWSSRSIGTSPS